MENELRSAKGNRVLAVTGIVAGAGLTGVGVYGVVWTGQQLSGGTDGDGLAYVGGLILGAGSALLAAGGLALTIGSIVGATKSTSKIKRLEKALERPRVGLVGHAGPRGEWSVGVRFRF